MSRMLPTTCYQQGPIDGKILLVGEAPGVQEVNQYCPFVGPSGELLEECLHMAGIVRRECIIQNVITEKVKKPNKASPKLFAYDGSMLYDGKSFTSHGEEFRIQLADRINPLEPNIVVTIGLVATNAFLPKKSVFKIRGSLFYIEFFGKWYKVIPTLHPAFCLNTHQLYWKHVIKQDLAYAKRESSSPEYSPPKRNLVIDPTFDETIQFLNTAREKPSIATDIEIYNKQVSCFSVGFSAQDAISVPLLDHVGRQRWTVDQELAIWKLYSLILGDPRILKINQNLLFDLQVLFQRNKIIPSPPYFCTMVAQILLHPDFPASLEFLSSIYTDEPYYKDDKKLWTTPDKDPLRFWAYNAKDSITAFIIAHEQMSELDNSSMRETHSFHMKLFHPLMEIMTNGLLTDQEKLNEVKKLIERDANALRSQLDEISDFVFNPFSAQQCIKYFYDHKKYYRYTNRKTGKDSCDELALIRIARRYNSEEARTILKLRNLSKLLSTYLEMSIDVDSRIRSSMHPCSRFGRLRSSKTIFGTGGNQQNFDPRFKEFIIPG